MRVRILGCGDSAGTPSITGNWGDCDPRNPKNKRTRTSLAIEHGGETWLMDTGPDLREQLLREGIDDVDGLFYTHAHSDHIMGCHELRVLHFVHKKLFPLYADAPTLKGLQESFGYMIRDDNTTVPPQIYPKFLTPHEIQGAFPWHGMTVETFEQDHGYSQSRGYRFPTWGYSTDVLTLDETAFDKLAGIRTWLVDCIAYTPKPSHAHLDRTLSWIERVKPERAILIHMSRFLDYDTLKKKLPKGVEPAYDGMVIDMD